MLFTNYRHGSSPPVSPPSSHLMPACPLLSSCILPAPPAHGCWKDKDPSRSQGIQPLHRTLGFIEWRLCRCDRAGIKHHSSILVSSAALFPWRGWSSPQQFLSNGQKKQNDIGNVSQNAATSRVEKHRSSHSRTSWRRNYNPFFGAGGFFFGFDDFFFPFKLQAWI